LGFHVQLDLKAIEQAAAASGAEGIGLREHLAGLVLMFHHVWTKKTDHASRELLMGWFGVGPEQVERLAAGMVAFEHLEPRGTGWRIRGATRYQNLRRKLSEGGKKSAGNLKQFSGAQQAPASTSSSESGPAAPSTPAPGKKPRALSDQEECWGVLEVMRVEHCRQRGIEPGNSEPPERCNAILLKAVKAVNIVDSIDERGAFTRWDYLALLFERYLAQERIGLNDKVGQPCVPPWPIPLFLSPGVLGRFKSDYEQEAA
jgi:hypothetical protein